MNKTNEEQPEMPWMKAFGGLKDLHRETKRIERVIEKEFERVDEDEWQLSDPHPGYE